MAFIQDPVYVLFVLFLIILLASRLARQRYFRQVGAVILVILSGAVLANMGLIPSSHNAIPLYDGIFTYAAPLAIFFLLLEVRLKDLRYAGFPMIAMFLVGSVATMAAVLLGYWIWQPAAYGISLAPAVAGMYTGTYIGGSANLNAVALHYEVNKEATLFAAVNAVDNLVGTPWMLATIVLPPILRKLIPRDKKIAPELKGMSDEQLRAMTADQQVALNVPHLAIMLSLGFGSLFLAQQVHAWLPAIPSILVLTTLALLIAQFPFVHKLGGAKLLGMMLILLFLAVVGAFCDLHAVQQSGEAAGRLVLWVLSIILVHGLIIFTVGGIFKQDWDLVAIASNANIGGSTSAPVCAAALGRPDLQLPGLLAGSLGNAIGTYAGLFVAEWLI